MVAQPSASPTAARYKCVITLPLNVSGDTIHFDNSDMTVVYFKLRANLFPTPAIKENSSPSLPALLPQGRQGAGGTSWNPRLSEFEEVLALCLHSWDLNHLLAQ